MKRRAASTTGTNRLPRSVDVGVVDALARTGDRATAPLPSASLERMCATVRSCDLARVSSLRRASICSFCSWTVFFRRWFSRVSRSFSTVTTRRRCSRSMTWLVVGSPLPEAGEILTSLWLVVGGSTSVASDKCSALSASAGVGSNADAVGCADAALVVMTSTHGVTPPESTDVWPGNVSTHARDGRVRPLAGLGVRFGNGDRQRTCGTAGVIARSRVGVVGVPLTQLGGQLVDVGHVPVDGVDRLLHARFLEPRGSTPRAGRQKRAMAGRGGGEGENQGGGGRKSSARTALIICEASLASLRILASVVIVVSAAASFSAVRSRTTTPRPN